MLANINSIYYNIKYITIPIPFIKVLTSFIRSSRFSASISEFTSINEIYLNLPQFQNLPQF